MRLLARSCLTFIVPALLSLSGCQDEISGTYVAKSANEVAFLQLVKMPDCHLTGRLGLVTLEADGKVNQSSTGLSGVIDHDIVILSVTALGIPTSHHFWNA
jgi:hypothetical protein